MIANLGNKPVAEHAAFRNFWQNFSAPAWAKPLAIFFALFALVVLLQLANGAFRSEFGAYPDEPAHYVTSLMLREYITGPHPFWPLNFAVNYYHHYPKVAFGHWPPVFYILQAIWMLPFSASRASVRLEIAFTTAILAFSVWSEFRRWFGEGVAIFTGVLLVCLPLVQESSTEEMAEPLLVLFCFWSAVFFSRYLDFGKKSDAIWFGIYFSLAVLTKGSGWLLVFIPPVAALLRCRMLALFRPSFWWAVLVIALLCLPWQLITLQSAARGWTGGTRPSLNYTLNALAQFSMVMIHIMGPILSATIVLGIVVSVVAPLFSSAVDSLPATMFALALGDLIFHSLVPAGVENRKMIIAVPALIFFLAIGALWIADRAPGPLRFLRWRRGSLLAVIAVVFATQAFTIPHARHYGYIEAALYLTSEPSLHNATILSSSQSGGEGMLISEVAMRQPRPEETVIRATKALAQVDWTGAQYKSYFTTPAQLLAYLAERRVEAVVLDDFPRQVTFAHHTLLQQTIEQNPTRFSLLAAFASPANDPKGSIRIYRVL